MALAKDQDGRKWINAGVAIGAVLFGIVMHTFFVQLSDWFDLEAKISNFTWIAQGLALAFGLGAFLVTTNYAKSKDFLEAVYGELVKVIWPDRQSVFRMTLGIIFGVAVVSIILVLVDLSIQKLLSLLY